MIYLDSAATTSIDPRVVDAMIPYLREHHGNPSSVHRFGRTAKAAVERAREQVAALFEGDPSEIVFTSGGSEANNFALFNAFRIMSEQGRTGMLTSAAEHHSVLKSFEELEQAGAEVTFLPVNHGGLVSEESVEQLTDDTGVVSLMHVNNETGCIHDIGLFAREVKSHGILFHTDAVQSVGKLPVSSRDIPYDFASSSAHKIHGPKGVGAVYIRRGLSVHPHLHGGSQERGRRGGTENVASIVGYGVAAEFALIERDQRTALWTGLRQQLFGSLKHSFPAMILNGEGLPVLPNILSVSFPSAQYPLDGEALVMNLDLEGLAVSSGSACTAGSIEPSHVMLALGHDKRTSASTLRFSFGAFTTREEVSRAAEILAAVVQRMLP